LELPRPEKPAGLVNEPAWFFLSYIPAHADSLFRKTSSTGVDGKNHAIESPCGEKDSLARKSPEIESSHLQI
jgi:hypothetical protein